MSRNITTKNTSFTEEDFQLHNTQNGKLLFTQVQGCRWAMLIENNRLTTAQILPDKPSQIGAIYIGKVKNVVKNIDACFVEIADKELCFLPLKEARYALVLNRTLDGRILEGDDLLVQVTRDAQKTKQASITAQISISNEAFAVSLGKPWIAYSNKLSKSEKQRLKTFMDSNDIINQFTQQIPQMQMGLVVRTQACSYSDEELKAALTSLMTDWVSLISSAMHRVCFSCIKEAPADFESVLQKLVYPNEYSEIITDDVAYYEKLTAYVSAHLPKKSVRLYQDDTFPLSKLYGLESKIETALNARIWLKSGGYLVIEPTEALTVIDVNSGKYEAKKGNREAIYNINREAAEEIALQLRLRNLSGIIIADFINMDSEDLQNELLEYLRRLVRKDKQKTVVVDMTPLGLVEITRKKANKPLYEQIKVQ